MKTYSPSQIGVWKQCPQAWDYNYNHGIRKAGSTRALDKGTYFHELAHVYYHALKETNFKPGSDFLYEMMVSRIKNDLSNVTADNLEVVNAVSKLILGFIRHQSPKIDLGIEIIGVEHEFKVPVRTPKGREVLLHGIIDLVYRHSSGRILIRDHKTSAKKGNWDQRKLSLDQQLMEYAVAMSIEMSRPIVDVEINLINSYEYKVPPPPADLFSVVRWQYSPLAIGKMEERLLSLIDVMLDTVPYRSYSKDCGSCQYYDLCELELRGLDTERVMNSNYVKRDVINEPGPKVADFFKVDAPQHASIPQDAGKFNFKLR